MGGPEGCVATVPSSNGVTIRKVENGFIVVVGCKTFVSTDWQWIADGLKEYWENPVEAEKKFCK